MSIIESYDTSEEIVTAELFTQGLEKLPKTAIVCFRKELIDYLESSEEYEASSVIPIGGDEIKIYRNTQKEDVVIYRTLMGAPTTAAIVEEMAARGVENFIFFGSCGCLEDGLESGAFILPTEAYRDEGTSYHYLPAGDFVSVDTVNELANIFDENNIKYIKAKTWTTDALYKETVNKTRKRVSEGCKVVEMECAAVMAVSKVRNLKTYYFLYSDDTLAGEQWDLRTLQEDRSYLLKECLKIAYKVAECA